MDPDLIAALVSFLKATAVMLDLVSIILKKH
jgi:hypothetical protein